MDYLAFWATHQWTIIFYTAMIMLIFLLRSKIEWQVFGIGMYKTKVGIKLMEKLGTKYRGWVQMLGVIGIGVGFIGMVFIVGNLAHGLWLLFTKPDAPAAIGLVLPGISLPGSAFKVPLITGWIALFTVIVIHEFSHGVVSRAHDIPVKSSGLLIFGPIGGAFVEPEEKKLMKQPDVVQHALFAAGPFSNVLSGGIFLLLAAFVLTPLILMLTVPGGVELDSVTPGLPAAAAGLEKDMVITAINGVPIVNYSQMSDQLDLVKVGETVIVTADGKDFSVMTVQHPTDAASAKGYMGVIPQSKRLPKYSGLAFNWFIIALDWFVYFLQWVVILSLGIGLANLLPIGPVDGGRMFQLAARQITGDKDRGDRIWKGTAVAVLAVILVLLIVPIVKALI
jgi:membrane-associated protease RseP (regulator of RpoE activity)